MRTIVSAAAALCLAAACGAGDGAEGETATQEVDTSRAGGSQTPGAANQPAPNVTNIPRPEQTMAAGRLSPVNNSGVTGSVNVRGIGEQTEISLNVTGVTAGNQQLQGAVVQGTCEQPGSDVAPLGPIPVGAGNIATLTDTLPLPPGTVLNGQHALIVKGQNAGPATPPLACSPLPQWQRMPPTG
ncbi:MAG TPA: hypothetical protein VHG08_11015 [Longimicrobium sp.]|nr:hypothetical protein [Longimicrobium sp.]